MPVLVRTLELERKSTTHLVWVTKHLEREIGGMRGDERRYKRVKKRGDYRGMIEEMRGRGGLDVSQRAGGLAG